MSDMVDLSSLRGRSVMILGGASGLGLAMAKRFAHAGAHITIADLNVTGGTRAVKDLQAQGLSATFVGCDTADHYSSRLAFDHALQTSPNNSIDVTALVAGVIGETGSLVDKVLDSYRKKHLAPPELYHSALDVNLLGVYQCAYLALWYMKIEQHGSGGQAKDEGFSKSLIFVSSTVAYTDVGNFADYHASKFGVRGLFRGLRHETPRLNIRTNCLAPYFMRTPLVENALDTFAAAGMEPGKGFTFVDVESVVDVAGRFAVDESLHGRVVAILPDPQGAVDLRDDEEGLWAGKVFKMVQDQRRAVGDII
ncbi:uncharacterized protein Z520_06313 [Fonsecaea multimorphosa CBS 102226]|uniref:Uncharacterized protein n=1 Tax=Fonsecaea multimorphosa CBS 102226 TaxID=1442371 RepID=A0A0D2KND6_9EURO|nr:uncharacterized protein Z520_06313 [Fonsecaea multimorphosa CBS 102226]KIX98233.1 hypothetical protein Z520_06313 [Fonsecaea multimorphosa CBS 102226]OAL22633.1 hypothetical protein AYO22_07191 [Fonsecaea multimorphosa]